MSAGPPETGGPVTCTSAPWSRPRFVWNSGRRLWKRWWEREGEQEEAREGGSPTAVVVVVAARRRTPGGV